MPNKLTPGTWTYNPDFSAVVVVHDHKLKAVADFGKTDLPETEANALAMSATKELLEILTRILHAHDLQHVHGATMGEAKLCPAYAYMARHAIQKATGGAS